MAATLPAWPTLKIGDSGKNVYALQYLLVYRGSFTGTPNGIFDPTTEVYVRQFQTKNNIHLDNPGVVGEATLTKLISPVQQVIVKNEGQTIPVTYNAMAAQYLLSKFESLTIDGKFGDGSATALASFQVRMRIPITGIADSLTWQYMFGYNTYPLSAVTPPSTSVYASVCAGNSNLSSAQMTKNAKYVLNWLMTNHQFTKNAACGVLGNMQQESGINPGIWQFLPSTADGYGLVQWTPGTKFFDWAKPNTDLTGTTPKTINNFAVYEPLKLMLGELEFLMLSLQSSDFFPPTGINNSGLTFKNIDAYKISQADAGKLALAFHDHYERSGDSPESVAMQNRKKYAVAWFNSL